MEPDRVLFKPGQLGGGIGRRIVHSGSCLAYATPNKERGRCQRLGMPSVGAAMHLLGALSVRGCLLSLGVGDGVILSHNVRHCYCGRLWRCLGRSLQKLGK